MVEKTISLTKDLYPGERRIMVLPPQVNQLREAGYRVFIEAGAGENAGVSNDAYRMAGAEIVSRDEAWKKPYVVKYKAPQPEEYQFFHKDLTLAASLHPEGEADLIAHMCKSGMTAYSFEYFITPEAIRPIPTSDMEITGKLAFFYGAYLLQTHFGGSGVLMSYVPGARRPKVLVIGYGNVGGAAARLAAAAGCDVVVLGTNRAKLRQFASTVPSNVRCRLNSPAVVDEEIVDADLVLGCILIATEETPAMVELRHLKTMRKGSLIMDVTCGYGDGVGWMPTFHRTTTHEEPVYEVEGILHCKIDRIPSRVPVTASEAKSVNITPYLVELGDAIFAGTKYPLADTGKIVERGKLVNAYVAESLKLLAAE